MSTKPCVLVLRAEPDATRTALALREHGFLPVIAPLFAVTPTHELCPAGTLAGEYAAIIITSANAARHVDMARHIPVLTVGSNSAEIAQKMGYTSVFISKNARFGLADLAKKTIAAGSNVLVAVGEHRHEDWLDDLRQAGFKPDVWTIYRSVAVEILPASALNALRGKAPVTALHFSNRSAEVFVELIQKAGLSHCIANIDHVVISNEAAKPLLMAGAKFISVAPEVDLAGVIKALNNKKVFSLDNSSNTRKDDFNKYHVNDSAASKSDKGVLENGSVSENDNMVRKPSKAEYLPKTNIVAADEANAISDSATADHKTELTEGTMISAPQQPEPQHSAPETLPLRKARSGPGWGGLIISGIMGGVIGAGGLFEAQKHFGSSAAPTAQPPQISALQVANWETRFSTLDKAIAARTAETAEFAARTGANLADISRKLDASTSAQSGNNVSTADPKPLAEIKALTERLALAEATTAQSTQALQAALPRLSNLETAARAIGTPSTQSAGATRLLLSERIRQALEAGRPFAADVKALGMTGLAEPALLPLLAVANKGASTAAQLRDDVRQQRRILAQENTSQPVSWTDQALAIASRVVSVQKLDGAMSMTPPALVTRMDAALQAGDVSAALGAWQALPEPARRASEALGQSMAQRVAADTSLKAIADTAVQALSAATAAR